MKMQYELLTDKFDDLDMTASAVGLIKGMAEGTDAHHADALKFGLREGFLFARPKPPGETQPTRGLFQFGVAQPTQTGKNQGRRSFGFG